MTLNEFALFKRRYKEATKKGAVSFMFKEQEYFIEYAKYVIEYYCLSIGKK